MKYSNEAKPLVCMQNNSTCYKNTYKMRVKGVLWHSTGANNPNLRRYVQPSEEDKDYSKLISLLGKNSNGNDWNHIDMEAGLPWTAHGIVCSFYLNMAKSDHKEGGITFESAKSANFGYKNENI